MIITVFYPTLSNMILDLDSNFEKRIEGGRSEEELPLDNEWSVWRTRKQNMVLITGQWP